MKRYRAIYRIAATIFCVAVAAWIFSNSLQTGIESAAQSSAVVELVQTAAKVVAPDSWVANASGEAYDELHFIVRKLAHFSEFALFGFSLAICYASWTVRKKYVWIPLVLLLFVPLADEGIQLFTTARAAQLTDVLIDCGGDVCGFLLATGVLRLVYKISKQRQGGVYGAGKS